MDRTLRILTGIAALVLLAALAAPASANTTFYLGDAALSSAPPTLPEAKDVAMASEYIDGRPLADWALLLDHAAHITVPYAEFWVQSDGSMLMPAGREANVPLYGRVDACVWTLTLEVHGSVTTVCSDAFAGEVMTGGPQKLTFSPTPLLPVHGRNMDVLHVQLSVTPAFPGTMSVLYNSTFFPSLVVLSGLDVAEHGPAPADGAPREGAGEAASDQAAAQQTAVGLGAPASAAAQDAAGAQPASASLRTEEKAAAPMGAEARSSPAPVAALLAIACLGAAVLRRRAAA